MPGLQLRTSKCKWERKKKSSASCNEWIGTMRWTYLLCQQSGVLYISQSFRTGASPSDGLVSYAGHSWGQKVLPLCTNAVSVFYSPS